MQTRMSKRNVLVIVGREAEPPIMVDALRPRGRGTGLHPVGPGDRTLPGRRHRRSDWAERDRRAGGEGAQRCGPPGSR